MLQCVDHYFCSNRCDLSTRGAFSKLNASLSKPEMAEVEQLPGDSGIPTILILFLCNLPSKFSHLF